MFCRRTVDEFDANERTLVNVVARFTRACQKHDESCRRADDIKGNILIASLGGQNKLLCTRGCIVLRPPTIDKKKRQF